MPKAKKKPTPTAATAASAGDRRMIPADLIDQNPWNGHRAADDDLIQSVAQKGVLQNLIVRPVGDRFQVVSGSRRLDAARFTDTEAVPCLVLDLDDRQAREITIIENLQRENLHPVDEAKAIAELLADGHTKEEVAARIGKTPAFVTRRAKLAAISPEVIQSAGADIGRASIRALELLATLPPAKQIDMFDGLGGVTIDADDIADEIARESSLVKDAPFDCSDATLVPEAGACANCPKRTGAEPLLFDDLSVVGSGDRCLDLDCYERKRDAAMARLEAKAREKHGDALILVADDIPYGEAGSAFRKRGVKQLSTSWHDTGLKRCKKSESGATPAFIVRGKGEGTTTWVRHVSKVQTPGAEDDGETTAAPAGSMESKREKLDQRRYAWMASKLSGMVGGEDEEGNRRLPAEKYCNDAAMVRIAAAFGGSTLMALRPGDEKRYHEDDWDFWKASVDVPTCDLFAHIWDAAAGSLRRGMTVLKVSDIDEDFVARCKAVADLVGQSWDALWDEACTEIPEPKAWSK